MTSLSSSAMVPDALRPVLDQIPSAVIFMDLQERVLFLNSQFTQMTGYTLEDWAPPQLILPDFILLPDKVLPDPMDPNHPNPLWEGRLENRRKDGNLLWTKIAVNIYHNEDGMPLGYLLILEDITPFFSVHEENTRFKQLMDNLRDNIYFKNTEGHYLCINAAYAQRLLLKDPAEAIGKCDYDFFSATYADEVRDDEKKVIHSKTPLINKLKEKTMPNGRTYRYLVSKYPIFDAKNEVVGLVGINKDVSNVKSSPLSPAIQPVPDTTTLALVPLDIHEWYVLTDANHVITQISTGLAQELQVPQEIMIGQSLAFFLSEHFGLDVHKQIQPFIQKTLRDKEILLGKNGQKDYKILLMPMSQDQQYLGLTLTIHDITDLKMARKQAEAANQGKTEFLKRMIFEIRTPLDGLMGMLDLAIEKNKDEELDLYLNISKECGRSIISLVRELMDITKIELGNFDIETSEAPLDHILQEAIKTLPLEEQPLISYDIDPRTPTTISGLLLPTIQVLSIMMEKAKEMMQTPNLYWRITSQERNFNQIQLMFGLSPNSIDLNCLPDRTRENVIAEEAQSYPLFGHFIKILNGHCWMERSGQKIVKICFEANYSTVKTTIPVLNSTLPRRAKVLVADDSRISGVVAKELLQHQNCEVRVVRNGKEVLQVLSEDIFDLILMDIEMPEMGGVEATLQIRENPAFQSLPILAMTAHTMDVDKKTYEEIGMNDLIPKPLDAATLAEKLDRWAPR